MAVELTPQEREDLEAAVAGAAAHLETAGSILDALTPFGREMSDDLDPDTYWRRQYVLERWNEATTKVQEFSEQLRHAGILA